MVKKVYLFLLVFFLLLPVIATDVHAKPNNVMECIENDADCEEIEAPMEDEGINSENEILLEEKPAPLIFDIVKMIVVLLFILGLIYFVLKLINKKNSLFQKGKLLENIGGISVGSNKSVQIIRIGTKMYLIGVGDTVQLLQEITDEELKQDLMKQHEEKVESNLSDSFKTLIGNNKKNQPSVDKPAFKQHFQKELSQLKRNRKELMEQHKKEERHE